MVAEKTDGVHESVNSSCIGWFVVGGSLKLKSTSCCRVISSYCVAGRLNILFNSDCEGGANAIGASVNWPTGCDGSRRPHLSRPWGYAIELCDVGGGASMSLLSRFAGCASCEVAVTGSEVDGCVNDGAVAGERPEDDCDVLFDIFKLVLSE